MRCGLTAFFFIHGRRVVILLYVAVMTAVALPASIFSSDAGVQSNQSEGGFFSTPQSELSVLEHRLAVELTDTLQRIPNVEEARVHLSLSSLGIWKFASNESSASVVIFSAKPSLLDTEKIQQLVAGASNQLSAEQIQVVVYHSSQAKIPKTVAQTPAQTSEPIRWEWVSVVLLILVGALVMVVYGVFRRVRCRRAADDYSSEDWGKVK